MKRRKVECIISQRVCHRSAEWILYRTENRCALNHIPFSIQFHFHFLHWIFLLEYATGTNTEACDVVRSLNATHNICQIGLEWAFQMASFNWWVCATICSISTWMHDLSLCVWVQCMVKLAEVNQLW